MIMRWGALMLNGTWVGQIAEAINAEGEAEIAIFIANIWQNSSTYSDIDFVVGDLFTLMLPSD